MFVRRLGARPVQIAARDHDRVVAATSALPQVVSSAVAWAAFDIAGEHSVIAGPGLHGVIRLAASPAGLWSDDLIANKRNVLRALNVFERRLHGFRRAIAAGERTRLKRLLRAGANARRRLSLGRQVFVSRTE
jgi:prephenate dehydrogenase